MNKDQHPSHQRLPKSSFQLHTKYFSFYKPLDSYKYDFHCHINIPLGPSPHEMLKFLHPSDPGQSQSILDSSSESIFQHQAILSTDVYQELEK